MRPDHDDINSVLDTLARERNTPLSEAYSLPPISYLSPAFFELESKCIFSREWVCPETPKPNAKSSSRKDAK